MSTCPRCHASVKDGARFCGACGAEMPQIPTCPKCGAEVASGAKFCGACGAAVGGSAPPPSPPESAPVSPPAVSPSPSVESVPPSEVASLVERKRGRLATAVVFCAIYLIAAIVCGIFGGQLLVEEGLEDFDLEVAMGLGFAVLGILYFLVSLLIWVVRPRFFRALFLGVVFLAVFPGGLLGAGFYVDTYMASGDTMYFRGVDRLHGLYSRFDDQKAVVWFERGMAKGHAGCVERMGYCYRYGIGSADRDCARAMEYYREAAKQGVGRASIALGNMHARGQGVPPDRRLAARYWEEGRLKLAKEQRRRLNEKDAEPYIVVGVNGKSGRELRDVRPASSGVRRGETVFYGPDTYMECRVFYGDCTRNPDDGGF